MAWFDAINRKDGKLAGTYFQPPNSGYPQSIWTNYESNGPPFTHVKCNLQSQHGPTATVLCTFKETPSPDEANPDTFWSVSLARNGSDRWLITGYGQG
jgi:hypothetical protein